MPNMQTSQQQDHGREGTLPVDSLPVQENYSRTSERYADKLSTVRKPKLKKCKVCKTEFEPKRADQFVCSVDCASLYIHQEKEKLHKKATADERKAYKEEKLKCKSLGEYKKEAQIAINAYRREYGLSLGMGCVSCGTKNGKINGGHYRSVGSSPSTRFEEINIWPQCERCNSYLSGNLIEYRKNLLKIIGQEKLDWLEGPHDPKHYTKEELVEIKKTYQRKLKELKCQTTT